MNSELTERVAELRQMGRTPKEIALPTAESESGESGESGLVGVLVARDTGSTVLACGLMVDVFCLGVKDTNGPKTMDRRKLPDFIRTFFSAWPGQAFVAAPLDLARHVVFGAVDYARALGFEPHSDFAKGAALLGDWEAGRASGSPCTAPSGCSPSR